METTHFKQPSSFTFSQSVANNDDLAGAPGGNPLPIMGEIHVKVSNLSPRERSIWVETNVGSHDPALVDVKHGQDDIAI
ncbi:MAG: hypothetical protein Q9222_005193, partial [Ikaeria aurantiellina]